jgi:hypothetical protein
VECAVKVVKVALVQAIDLDKGNGLTLAMDMLLVERRDVIARDQLGGGIGSIRRYDLRAALRHGGEQEHQCDGHAAKRGSASFLRQQSHSSHAMPYPSSLQPHVRFLPSIADRVFR